LNRLQVRCLLVAVLGNRLYEFGFVDLYDFDDIIREAGLIDENKNNIIADVLYLEARDCVEFEAIQPIGTKRERLTIIKIGIKLPEGDDFLQNQCKEYGLSKK
jgi:hypothetical protein